MGRFLDLDLRRAAVAAMTCGPGERWGYDDARLAPCPVRGPRDHTVCGRLARRTTGDRFGRQPCLADGGRAPVLGWHAERDHGWHVHGRRPGESHAEPHRYEISSVEKVGGRLWRFNAKMDCCGLGGSVVRCENARRLPRDGYIHHRNRPPARLLRPKRVPSRLQSVCAGRSPRSAK